jgi:hypothetical protein
MALFAALAAHAGETVTAANPGISILGANP